MHDYVLLGRRSGIHPDQATGHDMTNAINEAIAARHEQRLAALKAEYASEYETQVTKIMADEETWKSAAKHGFDEHAIAYVKEREAEIREANKLGVGTMHVPQAQIIKRDAIREFVTEEDDEQRAT